MKGKWPPLLIMPPSRKEWRHPSCKNCIKAPCSLLLKYMTFFRLSNKLYIHAYIDYWWLISRIRKKTPTNHTSNKWLDSEDDQSIQDLNEDRSRSAVTVGFAALWPIETHGNFLERSKPAKKTYFLLKRLVMSFNKSCSPKSEPILPIIQFLWY